MNTKTITEPSRKIPVEASYDVAVVGGGIAGVAAALAAAREGVEVVLLERTFGLGGLATLGNVIMYLPLCDGMGRQVMAGIAEELLHLSVYDVRRANRDARFLPVPDCWKGGDEEQAEARQKKRLMAAFNPASFQIEMEVLLEKEGVALMYDTRVCQVQTKADQVSHLIVENKSGRLGLEVGAVIDASGDADVCAVAGCPVEVFDSNVLAAWHYLVRDGRVQIKPMSNPYDKEHGRGTRAAGPFFSGIEHRALTRHVLESRKMLRDKLFEMRDKFPDEEIFPFNIPSIPDIRMTRRLCNRFSLREEDKHTWMEDCLGLTGDWRRRGPVYPIPLRSIQSDMFSNLYAVGRCMSADKTVCDVTRAIQTCAVSGEAAGVCGALQVKNPSWREIQVESVQGVLKSRGVILDQALLEEIGY